MALADPAWLDAEYNARAAIADHPAIFERWRAASGLARSQLPCELDVAYGADPAERLDVFPAGDGAPVLVFVHGGYWRSLDKADHRFIAPSFVADGAAVVLPNYSLCPAASIEQIAVQTARAVAWVLQHIREFGGDPSRVALAGHSAGAHLVAMLLCCRWKDVAPGLPLQPLQGGLGISGLYDLEPVRQAPFLADDLRLTPASVRRLSPAFFPRPRRPLYAVVGGDESSEFHRQTQLIRDQWGPTSVPVCETLVGQHHLSILTSLADPAGRLHDLALRLLTLR
ncbi:alpha/beta hydrolase [Ideonella sp.]|uniref:alpha/beta hydrolase n=1 Tax=Ideonella sp. TaxID=1929293 RepID=UPI0035B4CF76